LAYTFVLLDVCFLLCCRKLRAFFGRGAEQVAKQRASNSVKDKAAKPTRRAASAKPARASAKTGKPRPSKSSKSTGQRAVPKGAKSAKPSATKAFETESRRNGQNGQAAAPTPSRKSRLSPSEFEEFRQLLLDKRREVIGDVRTLQNEVLRKGSSGETSGGSTMPIHMADLGSDTWEQELTLGLIENERGLLREIDEALARIEDRTYGVCMATNKPITKARLRAKPWAKYCIEYARKRELGLV
jgi:DnaK suppressor protein